MTKHFLHYSILFLCFIAMLSCIFQIGKEIVFNSNCEQKHYLLTQVIFVYFLGRLWCREVSLTELRGSRSHRIAHLLLLLLRRNESVTIHRSARITSTCRIRQYNSANKVRVLKISNRKQEEKREEFVQSELKVLADFYSSLLFKCGNS